MNIKTISIIVAVLLSVVLSAGYVSSAPNTVVADEEQPKLLGVRLTASEADLQILEAAAKAAGWTESRRDKPGTVLLLRPKQYRVEQFGALLEAIEATRIRRLGLQLIGPDGRAVDPDGNPIEEK